MYLYCHGCGWSQDDFWSADYNPIKSLQFYAKDFADPAKLDEVIPAHDHIPAMTGRERIVNALRGAILHIEGMKFLTPPKGAQLCPQCGQHNLDSD